MKTVTKSAIKKILGYAVLGDAGWSARPDAMPDALVML
jgi:hypothetical protein